MNAAAGVVGALVGAIIGSFIATLCLRWPKAEQVLFGRSRCDGCGRALQVRELVPALSGLLSRGRCRTCDAPIDPIHWQVELAAAFLAGTALTLEPSLRGLAIAGFWLLLLPIALLDARHFWLPDRLTLLLAAAGVVMGGEASGTALEGRLAGGAAGFLGLWLLALLYRGLRGRDGLGGGDPKLLGAIGLWVGWQPLPAILLIAASGGLIAAAILRRERSEKMPFGTMMALAAIFYSGMGLVVPLFGIN